MTDEIADGEIMVEVVYAGSKRQFVATLPVPIGSTVVAAIQQSGVLSCFPEIVLSQNHVGIYGHPVSLTDPVHAGDRIEIYRPLLGDPREIRRQLVAQRCHKI